ncbi:carboxypeptidase-like regulatory domain-containing protein [Flavihumibacter fluvii]|uniref:carboxypeptidase-like regulatory domain-containing protein n=1 Tax=Flavihumibacter fluvii TaxID=2838157 RepID=UPI001BDEEE69|nr:carboxypeptidase-like regulatory domain-containing protein [Flavihumibacter fluvii]ULQ54417.1 carboxypeptidase-like regulatory domain-containing protein [Flavihumibacter fluvii]
MRHPISCPSWVYFLLVVIISSCHKTDIGPGTVETPTKENANLVSIGLNGRVIDELQNPVNGAIVRSGNQLAQTDINGNFSFSNLMVNPAATLIEVSKSGFFKSYKTIQVQPESDQFVDISLKPQADGHTFNAAAGTNFELTDGAILNFQSETIADKISSQQYSGIVRLSAYSYNSGDGRFFSLLPGVKGYNLSKRDVVLQPISMLVTELTGASGQSLQLSAGKTASLKFPIADIDLGSAPATISMWHYDINNGIWMEEGKAVKNGNYYEATVGHFSIWACGTAEPLISLQANITDKNDNGLPYSRLQLFSENGQRIVSTINRTDGNGYITMPAPAGQALEFRIINDCGEVLVSRKINSGSNPGLWLGKVNAAVAGVNSTTITGQVENCKSNSVYNGHVSLELEGRIYRARISEGKFSVSVNRCSSAGANANLIAVDDAGNQESGLMKFAIQSGTNNLGIISTCDPRTSQFISYNINGTNYLLQAPADSLVQAVSTLPNKTTILCYRGTDRSKAAFTFTFSGIPKPGQYPVSALSISQDKLAFTPNGNIAVEVTNYGEPGGFITGKCMGKVKSSLSNQSLPFSFSFKVLRNF